jgi:hypothetical protein
MHRVLNFIVAGKSLPTQGFFVVQTTDNTTELVLDYVGDVGTVKISAVLLLER